MEKTSITGTTTLNSGFTKFYGFSVLSEDTVELEFYDGSGASVPFLFLEAVANTTSQQWFDDPVILYGGLHVVVSGTIEGVIWWQDYENGDGSVEYPIQDKTRGSTAP